MARLWRRYFFGVLLLLLVGGGGYLLLRSRATSTPVSLYQMRREQLRRLIPPDGLVVWSALPRNVDRSLSYFTGLDAGSADSLCVIYALKTGRIVVIAPADRHQALRYQTDISEFVDWAYAQSVFAEILYQTNGWSIYLEDPAHFNKRLPTAVILGLQRFRESWARTKFKNISYFIQKMRVEIEASNHTSTP